MSNDPLNRFRAPEVAVPVSKPRTKRSKKLRVGIALLLATLAVLAAVVIRESDNKPYWSESERVFQMAFDDPFWKFALDHPLSEDFARSGLITHGFLAVPIGIRAPLGDAQPILPLCYLPQGGHFVEVNTTTNNGTDFTALEYRGLNPTDPPKLTGVPEGPGYCVVGTVFVMDANAQFNLRV